MTARRDRAVAHATLISLRRVLDAGRWLADGPDLLEAALVHTSRRSWWERARSRTHAEAYLFATALPFAFLADYAHDRWGIAAAAASGAAGICLYNAGAAGEARAQQAEAQIVHDQLLKLRDLVISSGRWETGCTDLLAAALDATRPHGRHR